MKKGLVKKIIITFLIILGIILVFTFFDYLVHSMQEYAVPSYYFRNKIISGAIIGFIAYLIFRKQRQFTKVLLFSAIISILLQIRYALTGFSLSFVIDFLFIHFAILFVISLIAFKFLNKYLFK